MCFPEWGRSPIYRRWGVRGLDYEGIEEETTSTIHAQERLQCSKINFNIRKSNPRSMLEV